MVPSVSKRIDFDVGAEYAFFIWLVIIKISRCLSATKGTYFFICMCLFNDYLLAINNVNALRKTIQTVDATSVEVVDALRSLFCIND